MNESFSWNPWNMETILIAILVWHVPLILGMVYMWSDYLCSYPLKFSLPDKLGITPDSSEQIPFSNVTIQMLGVDSQDPSLSTQLLVPKFVPSQVVIPKVVAASQPQQLERGSLIFNPFNFKSFKKLFSFRVCVSIALHIMWLLNWYLILSTLWMLVFGGRICQISLCRLCFMNLCCNIVILIIYF